MSSKSSLVGACAALSALFSVAFFCGGAAAKAPARGPTANAEQGAPADADAADVGSVVARPRVPDAVDTLEAPPNSEVGSEDAGSGAKDAAAEAVESEPVAAETPTAKRWNARQPAAAPRAAKAPPKTTEGVATPPLFRIRSAGGAEIYLVGTFHALPAALDWRSDALAAAIDKAETLMFEAEVDTPAAELRAQNILARHGFLPPGQQLSRILGAEDWTRLTTAATEVGLDPAALERVRPWQTFLALSARLLVKEGFDPKEGVEQKMLAEARLRGRTLRFFETIDDQLALFARMPPEEEKQLLTFTLADWESQGSDMRRMLAAWRAGDLETIDALMNATMRRDVPGIYERLLVQRNAAWTDRIEAMLDQPGAVVIAVGVAHLAGTDSVPAMLQTRGVAVERIGV